MKDEVIFVDKICKCSVASEAVMEADAVPVVAPTSEMAPVLLAEIQSRNRERWELTDETPLGHPKVLHSESKASEASYVYILSGQKLIKNAKNGSFWRVFKNLKLAVKQCYQTGHF